MCRPLKKRAKPTRINYYVGDIETWDGLRGEKFRKSALYNGRRPKLYNTCDEMMKFIVKANRVVYFHNLSFDGRFIIDWGLNNKDYIKHEDGLQMKIIYNHGIIGIIFRYFCEERNKYIIIKIIDSLRILLMGQAKLEEVFLGKKVKVFVDWEQEVSDEQIIERVVSDVKGMHQVLMTFFDQLHENYGVWSMGMFTLPSIAMKMYRTNYQPYAIYNPFIKYGTGRKLTPNTMLDKVMRRAYYGGRVEVFGYNMDLVEEEGQWVMKRNGKVIEEMDANSLFPTQFSKPYPIGKYRIYSLRDFDGVPPSKYEGVFVGKLYEKYSYLPVLPTRYTGKTKYGYGEKIGSYPLPLIRYADDLGLLNLLEGWWVLTDSVGTPFKDFADGLYSHRVQMQKEGNYAMSYIDKICLNGFYGKWGQSFNTTSYDLFKGEADIFEDELLPQTIVQKDDYFIVSKEIEMTKQHQMVDKALYTTAYANIDWHKQALKCETLLYADTDSIHGTGLHHIPRGTSLGEWKPEYHKILQAVYITPKVYWVLHEDEDGVQHTQCKAKGFPKSLFQDEKGKARTVSLWEFLEIIKAGFEKPVYMSLKQAMRQAGKPLASHVFSRRIVNDESEKRFFLPDGTSEPYEIRPPYGEMRRIKTDIMMLRAEMEDNDNGF